MEQWAELRREHFVRGVSIKELARRTGLSRNTVRAALRASEPPVYRRRSAGSKLDPFKDEIHRLLFEAPDMPGQRVRELIAPLGFDGGKTIVDVGRAIVPAALELVDEARGVGLGGRRRERDPACEGDAAQVGLLFGGWPRSRAGAAGVLGVIGHARATHHGRGGRQRPGPSGLADRSPPGHSRRAATQGLVDRSLSSTCCATSSQGRACARPGRGARRWRVGPHHRRAPAAWRPTPAGCSTRSPRSAWPHGRSSRRPTRWCPCSPARPTRPCRGSSWTRCPA